MIRRFVVAFATIFLVIGCTEIPPEEHRLKAQQLLADNQVKAAIIELKNAIEKDPNEPTGRYLLGTSYLTLGQGAFAQKELEMALKLGFDAEQILPKYLRSLKLQNEDEQILNLDLDIYDLSTETRVQALIYKAESAFRQKDSTKANSYLMQARELSEDVNYSQYGKALFALISEKNTEAYELLKTLHDEQPNNVDIISLLGQLAITLNKFDEAIQYFTSYLEQQPEDQFGKLLLADALFKNKEFDEAEQYVDILLKLNPNHGLVNYYKAFIVYQRRDYEATLAYVSKAIQAGVDGASSKLIGGVSAYMTQKYEQAYKLLAPIENDLPADHEVRKVIAVIELTLGYEDKAYQTLKSANNTPTKDAELLAITSFQLMKSKQSNEAEALLNEIDTAAINSANTLTKFGLLKLNLGDDRGFNDIKRAFEADSNSDKSNMAMVLAYVYKGEFDNAISQAKAWAEKMSNSAEPTNVLARLYLHQDKKSDATKAYAKSLQIEPNDTEALLYNIDDAIITKKWEKAKSLLSQILKLKPNSVPALERLIKVGVLSGNRALYREPIEQAYTQNSDDITYILLQARVNMLDGDSNNNVSLLSSVNSRTKRVAPIKYWVYLAEAYSYKGNYEKYLGTFKQWNELQPDVLLSWVYLAAAYERGNTPELALKVISDGLNKHKGNQALKLIQTYYTLTSGNMELAEQRLGELSTELMSHPLGQSVRGQLALSKGEYEKALIALQQAYKHLPSSQHALLIYRILHTLDKKAESQTFLEQRLVTHKDDITARIFLANMLLHKAPEKAKQHYLMIIERQPDNYLVLNNLAWLLSKEGKYSEALPYAEKAVKLSNNNQAIVSTLEEIKKAM